MAEEWRPDHAFRGVKGWHMRTHGKTDTPEYAAWKNMKSRCLNANTPQYKHYGARGITIDPTWMDFLVFLADMGLRPSPKHSIERKDNNKGYSKGNCVWATKATQNRNRRKL